MDRLMQNLFDYGGQNECLKKYMSSKRKKIFSKVEILIFLMEAEELKPSNNNNDITYFEEYLILL